MSSRLALLVVIAGLAGVQPVLADAPPCDGCVFVPAQHAHRPLVVLMHGDDQSASTMTDAFREIARERDLALFAPECPVKHGCDRQSFWRWNGDPAWLAKLVDELVHEQGLDADRVWLVGWSGGAAYLGFRIADLGSRYAAIALLGGGSPGTVCAKHKPPMFVLTGDKNPHYPLMQATRERLVGCGHHVTWKLLAGRDHDDEWHAIVKPTIQVGVFDFLDAHTRAKPLAVRIDALLE